MSLSLEAINVVMAGVDLVLEDESVSQAVCAIGSHAKVNVLGVGARYALLRHGLDRVGVILSSAGVNQESDANVMIVEGNESGLVTVSLVTFFCNNLFAKNALRTWGAELVLTDTWSLQAWLSSQWPEVISVSVCPRLPAELVSVVQQAAVDTAAATTGPGAGDAFDGPVAEDDAEEESKKRGRVEVDEEIGPEKQRRVGVDDEEAPPPPAPSSAAAVASASESVAAASSVVDEGEEAEVNIFDEPLAPTPAAERRWRPGPSNEEESQEGSARDGPDLIFDQEASEKSMTEAVEGRHRHPVPAPTSPVLPPVRQQQRAVRDEEPPQPFVPPATACPTRSQDDLDMDEINQLIGEELASL